MNEQYVTYDASRAILFAPPKITIPEAESLKMAVSLLLANSVKEIILDLSMAESIDSTGISALLLCHKDSKKKGCKLALNNVSGELSSLFKILKLDKIFKFFEYDHSTASIFDIFSVTDDQLTMILKIGIEKSPGDVKILNFTDINRLLKIEKY
ncbi:MAG: STAS domain-containing protein [bacterium]|nr:STAS domain-containing protein [bacterium]